MSKDYKTIREKIFYLDKKKLIFGLVGIIAGICLIVSPWFILQDAENSFIVTTIFSLLTIIGCLHLVDLDIGYHFICPNRNCLMTNFVINMKYVCPKCNTDYNTQNQGWIGRKKAIFRACSSCRRTIQFLECYECHEPIDLDSPYDEMALEKLSNEV